jgi:hypothetical protein
MGLGFDQEFSLANLFILLLVSSGFIQNYRVISFQFKFGVVSFGFAGEYGYFGKWFTFRKSAGNDSFYFLSIH